MAERAYIVTKGVVLRETETKEADKILTLLTADRGKISVIARGVRRKSCKYAACAQQMVYSESVSYTHLDVYKRQGQRRYVESLSSYARMFLGQMDKPDVDYIEGLSPAISIDQKTTSKNPRSTVGTVTEI